MKKHKGKVELRYYDVPQDEFLIVLQGEQWRMRYGVKDTMLHFHNVLEIGVCKYGTGNMILENETLSYHKGMISLIPPNYPHSTVSEGETENYWEYIFIDTEKVLQAVYPDDILFQQKMLERIHQRAFLLYEIDAPIMTNLVRIILNETRKKDDLYKECVRGLVLSLLINIARINNSTSTMPEGLRQKNSFDQVRPALEHIRANYTNPMKISEIASICHMSESHFRRLFEENIDMTPVEYLNQVRVRKACELIKKTGYSMEEIAVKVGFTTTSTFNRNFKRITGVSPYQWKKKSDNYESRLANFNILIEKGW